MKTWVVSSSAPVLLVVSVLLSLSSVGQCRLSEVGGRVSQQQSNGVESVISESMFDEMLKYRNDPRCPAKGFYTYDAFITAAKTFPEFGTTGNATIQKKEIAAFFGQTSRETYGGWPEAPGGPYSWGYCFIEENNPSNPYHGRGPIQLSYDYNYRQFGDFIHKDLLSDPDLLARDPVISFQSAIWFWMTPQAPKPSCHDVIIGEWQPTQADVEANRLPGYGVITNIINGGVECGQGFNQVGKDRIGFYERYCGMFGISDNTNLDCYHQRHFGYGLLLEDM